MVLPYPNHESKRKKMLLICLVIGILFFFIILLPAAALTGLWIDVRHERAKRTPQVKVPNVIGQDFRKGEVMLKAMGLSLHVLAKRWDQSQPVDIILDQVPRGGESVDLGYNVDVTIGSLPPEGNLLRQR